MNRHELVAKDHHPRSIGGMAMARVIRKAKLGQAIIKRCYVL